MLVSKDSLPPNCCSSPKLKTKRKSPEPSPKSPQALLHQNDDQKPKSPKIKEVVKVTENKDGLTSKKADWRDEEEKRERERFEKQIAPFDPEMQQFIRENHDYLSRLYYDPKDAEISLVESVHKYDIQRQNTIVHMDGKTSLSLDEVYDLVTKKQKQKEGPRSWVSVSGFYGAFLPDQGRLFYLSMIAKNSKRYTDKTYKNYQVSCKEILEMWRTDTSKTDMGTHMHKELEVYFNLLARNPVMALKFLLGNVKDKKQIPPRSDLGIPPCGQAELLQAKACLDKYRLKYRILATEKRFFDSKYRVCGTCDVMMVERATPITQEQLALEDQQEEVEVPKTFEDVLRMYKFVDPPPKTAKDPGTLRVILLDYKRSPKIDDMGVGRDYLVERDIDHGPGTKHWNPFWFGVGPCSELEVCQMTKYDLALNSYTWGTEKHSKIRILDIFYSLKVTQMDILEFHPGAVGYKIFKVPDLSSEIQGMLEIRLKCLEENKFVTEELPSVYDVLFPERVKWPLAPPEMAMFNSKNSNPKDPASMAAKRDKNLKDLAWIKEISDRDEEAIAKGHWPPPKSHKK